MVSPCIGWQLRSPRWRQPAAALSVPALLTHPACCTCCTNDCAPASTKCMQAAWLNCCGQRAGRNLCAMISRQCSCVIPLCQWRLCLGSNWYALLLLLPRPGRFLSTRLGRLWVLCDTSLDVPRLYLHQPFPLQYQRVVKVQRR